MKQKFIIKTKVQVYFFGEKRQLNNRGTLVKNAAFCSCEVEQSEAEALFSATSFAQEQCFFCGAEQSEAEALFSATSFAQEQCFFCGAEQSEAEALFSATSFAQEQIRQGEFDASEKGGY